jgi:hypothetical protein
VFLVMVLEPESQWTMSKSCLRPQDVQKEGPLSLHLVRGVEKGKKMGPAATRTRGLSQMCLDRLDALP